LYKESSDGPGWVGMPSIIGRVPGAVNGFAELTQAGGQTELGIFAMQIVRKDRKVSALHQEW